MIHYLPIPWCNRCRYEVSKLKEALAIANVPACKRIESNVDEEPQQQYKLAFLFEFFARVDAAFYSTLATLAMSNHTAKRECL
jgi:hypothetical protein